MKLTKKKALRVIQLIEYWTKAEIMARMSPISNKDFTNYVDKKIELEDEIRQELFGEKDLVKLGKKWGLV